MSSRNDLAVVLDRSFGDMAKNGKTTANKRIFGKIDKTFIYM